MSNAVHPFHHDSITFLVKPFITLADGKVLPKRKKKKKKKRKRKTPNTTEYCSIISVCSNNCNTYSNHHCSIHVSNVHGKNTYKAVLLLEKATVHCSSSFDLILLYSTLPHCFVLFLINSFSLSQYRASLIPNNYLPIFLHISHTLSNHSNHYQLPT